MCKKEAEISDSFKIVVIVTHFKIERALRCIWNKTHVCRQENSAIPKTPGIFMALGSQAIAPARIITQQGLYSIVQTLAKYIHLLKSRCCFTIDIKPSSWEIKALQLDAPGNKCGNFRGEEETCLEEEVGGFVGNEIYM